MKARFGHIERKIIKGGTANSVVGGLGFRAQSSGHRTTQMEVRGNKRATEQNPEEAGSWGTLNLEKSLVEQARGTHILIPAQDILRCKPSQLNVS